jgi:hypothetical protein
MQRLLSDYASRRPTQASGVSEEESGGGSPVARSPLEPVPQFRAVMQVLRVAREIPSAPTLPGCNQSFKGV